nr:ABC transporter permease subunit [Ardenticatena sp.]
MFDWENVSLIVQKEMRDALQNRWFLIFALMFTTLTVGFAWLGVVGARGQGLAGFGRTAATLINLVLLIVPLMALTLGAMSLASEREQGSLAYLMAYPIGHGELLLGKFIGLAAVLCATLATGFGIGALVLAWGGSNGNVRAYAMMVLVAMLLTIGMAAVGILISVFSRRVATAVGASIFTWLLFVFIGDLGVLGTAFVRTLPLRSLFMLTILNPLQVFKLSAIMAVQSNLDVLGPAGLYAMRTYGTHLSFLLVAILTAWTLIPLTLSYTAFKQRDTI